MSKKENKDKEEKEETSLATTKSDVPSWLTPIPVDGAIEGLENMRPGDMLVPRLMLMQALSPQVVEGDKKAGQILNSITGEIWIDKDEAVNFIPVYHYLEWIKWGDRETGVGILDRSLDPEGALAQSAMRQEKHTNTKGIEVFTVTEYHNFISIFPEKSIEIPVVISCAKTNLKKARKLLGLARYRGRFPLYAGMYTIQGAIETNKASQKYYTFEFKNAGWVSKEDYEPLQKLYNLLKDAYDQRKILSHQLDEDVKNEEEL